MKKISVLLLSMMLVILLAGCNLPTETKVEIDTKKPWWTFYFESETARYTVADYHLDGDSKYTLNDTENSFLEYKLTQSPDGINNATVYVLETNYQIVYENEEKNFIMHSVAKFDTNDLYAVFTSKEVKSLETNYYFEADYINGVAKYADSRSDFDADLNVRKIEFQVGNYIDNEYLYHYIRAMEGLTSALKNSSSFRQNFKLVNWFECFNKNSFILTPISTGSAISPLSKQNWENISVENKDFTDCFEDEYKLTEEDGDKLICHCVAITIMDNDKQKGQALYSYFTQGEYTSNTDVKTQKIMTKMINYYPNEADLQKNPPEYNNLIEIVLNDYSIKERL